MEKNELFENIRKYFLCFDQAVKYDIMNMLEEDNRRILLKLEEIFHSEKDITEASDFYSLEIETLKDIQLEYYLEMVEMTANGGNNQEIEKLDISENKIFQKIKNVFGNNFEIENEIHKAIKHTERQTLKIRMELIEEGIVSVDLNKNVAEPIQPLFQDISNGKETETTLITFSKSRLNIFWKLSAAALVLGVIGLIAFWKNSSAEGTDHFSDAKEENIRKILGSDMPILNFYNLVVSDTLVDVYSISNNRIDKPIGPKVRLKIWDMGKGIEQIKKTENEIFKGIGRNEISYYRLMMLSDSIMSIMNTYTYDKRNNSVELWLNTLVKPKTISLFMKLENPDHLYLKLDKSFYFITPELGRGHLVEFEDINSMNSP